LWVAGFSLSFFKEDYWYLRILFFRRSTGNLWLRAYIVFDGASILWRIFIAVRILYNCGCVFILQNSLETDGGIQGTILLVFPWFLCVVDEFYWYTIINIIQKLNILYIFSLFLYLINFGITEIIEANYLCFFARTHFFLSRNQ